MHLAASPFAPPQDASSDVIPTLRPLQCQLETPGVKAAPNSIVANFPTLPTGWLLSSIKVFFRCYRLLLCLQVKSYVSSVSFPYVFQGSTHPCTQIKALFLYYWINGNHFHPEVQTFIN
jgi:hypothetical protein